MQQTNAGRYFLGDVLLNKYQHKESAEKILLIDASLDKMHIISYTYKTISSLYYFSNGFPFSIQKVNPTNASYIVGNAFSDAPLHCTASGKIALSLKTEKELQSYLTYNPLIPLSDFTITTLDELKENLLDIREKGFSIENQELCEGISSISVPIYIGERVVGTMSITNTSYLIDKNAVNIALELKKHSIQISKRMI